MPVALNPPASPTLSQVSTSDTSFSFSTSLATGASSYAVEYDCLLFTALVRYVHREGDIGDAARAGVLALVSLARASPVFATSPVQAAAAPTHAASSPATSTPAGERDLLLVFAEWILESDLAEVVSASIGALYGALPTKLAGRSEAVAPGADRDAALAGSGMVLGGMGALQDEGDAEAAARKREEEEDSLRAQGFGIAGSPEVTGALVVFSRVVDFVQQVVLACSGPRISLEAGRLKGGLTSDPTQRELDLVLGAVASNLVATIRTSFLQGVLYPSILECSEADGSAVAVLSYLDAMFDVLKDGDELEAAIFAFLLAEETAPTQQAAVSTPLRQRLNDLHSHGHRRKRSHGLVLLDKPALRTSTSDDYFTAGGRFSLRDLLQSNIESVDSATVAAALRLLKTILTKHDRWSLALLDVEVDDLATAFPGITFAALPPVAHSGEHGVEATLGADEEEPFVYASQEPRTPRARTKGTTFPSTPASVLRPLLERGNGQAGSQAAGTDPLEALLSLVGEIDPSYRRMRNAGGGSEISTTGFANYLRDAETELGRDPGFRRGLASLVHLEDEALGEVLDDDEPRRSAISRAVVSKRLSGLDLASTETGRRHHLDPASTFLSTLLGAFSALFEHPPEVNLALTEAIATLALSPYRSLEGWCLPVDLVEPRDHGRDNGGRLFIPAMGSAAEAQNDSLLSILRALASSIEAYRRRIPKFDEYLGERRKGLFFADNLADALGGLSLASDLAEGTPSSRPLAPPIALPIDPSPAPKPSVTSGLVSLFSPRRQPHKRSPSTPNAFMTPTRPGGLGLQRPSQLRRSASDESLAAPLSPTAPSSGRDLTNRSLSDATALVAEERRAAGPASPFAAHYRETGSVQVQPLVVSTPSRRAREQTRARSGLGLEETAEADETDGTSQLGEPDSPSRRLSNLPVEAGAPGPGTASLPSSSPLPTSTAKVSLSMILDNVIVLEEFVKELAAIVYVRRVMGIDPIRVAAAAS